MKVLMIFIQGVCQRKPAVCSKPSLPIASPPGTPLAGAIRTLSGKPAPDKDGQLTGWLGGLAATSD
jgi:hypothetical protein